MAERVEPTAMRVFETGATRNTDEHKLDYEGFLSPIALERYAQYLHKHRFQADGKVRDSDNWQKGIPFNVYMKSLWRHFMDLWKLHRGYTADESLEDALCAIIFNAQGYLHENLKLRIDGRAVQKYQAPIEGVTVGNPPDLRELNKVPFGH